MLRDTSGFQWHIPKTCDMSMQRVCCQIDESVFLICMCYLKLQRVELSRPPYISDRQVSEKKATGNKLTMKNTH